MTKSVFIGRSVRHDKKYMVLINRKLIHFGKSSEFNFTQTHDVNAKRIYLTKHPGLNDISKKDLLYKPSFWERWLLWNKPTKRESIRYLEDKMNITIRPFKSKTLRHIQKLKGGSKKNYKAAAVLGLGGLAAVAMAAHKYKTAADTAGAGGDAAADADADADAGAGAGGDDGARAGARAGAGAGDDDGAGAGAGDDDGGTGAGATA